MLQVNVLDTYYIIHYNNRYPIIETATLTDTTFHRPSDFDFES